MALQVNQKNFKEIIESGKPVVLDFWAEWCGPCKKIAPLIDELATEYQERVIIGKVDVEENDDMTTDFKIKTIPTLLFFKDGELVDKMIAPNDKKQIIERIEKLL